MQNTKHLNKAMLIGEHQVKVMTEMHLGKAMTEITPDQTMQIIMHLILVGMQQDNPIQQEMEDILIWIWVLIIDLLLQ